jgi:dUTP pyrophosphatase
MAVQHGIPVAVLTTPEMIEKSWALADVPRFTNREHLIDWLGGQELALPRTSLVFHVEPGGRMPTRSHTGDAGYDLYCAQTTVVDPGRFVDVPTGLRVALPSGVWLRICGRSSTLRKRGLLCAEGVIDTGYRGPLYGGVWNMTGHRVVVEAGERIIQAVPHSNLAGDLDLSQVGEATFKQLPAPDDRGPDGFGSTGG